MTVNMFLTDEQSKRYAEFQEFAAANVEPFAGEWDRAQQIPESAVSTIVPRRLFRGQHSV